MKLHSLQALRAIAAWLVVADHALLDITRNEPSVVTATAYQLGTIGVQIFFVISGFIMVHISWDDFAREGAAANFLRRRIIRIVPLYWIATFAAFAFHKFSETHGADAGWLEVTRSLLFIPTVNETGRWSPVLAQGWTLSYEMIFYAIFTLVLFVRRQIALTTIAVSLGALTLLGFFVPSGVMNNLTSPIVLWFVLGAAGGAFWRRQCLEEPQSLARCLRFLEPFGNASYSTYLVHGLALTVLFRACQATVGAPSTMWFLTIGLAFTTVVGWWVHVLLEKPVLRITMSLWRRVGGTDSEFRIGSSPVQVATIRRALR